MEVQYAPEGVRIGDEIDKEKRWPRGKVIAVGQVFVIVRDKAGFTRTLIRKLEPARKLTKGRKQ